jgi:hypothetical protein
MKMQNLAVLYGKKLDISGNIILLILLLYIFGIGLGFATESSGNILTNDMQTKDQPIWGGDQVDNFGTTQIPVSNVPSDFTRRAAQLLEEVRGTDMAPEWRTNAKLKDKVTPFYRPDMDGIAYYEFMVEPTGFILLSATENDIPVSHWSSKSTPISTELEREAENSGKNAARFYKLDSLSYAAEDSSGELVATLGELPLKLKGLDPAWLKSDSVGGSEFIMMSGNGESDDKVDPERSVEKTGPEESPVQIQNWTSWAELKAGYSQTYAVLLDKLRMDAAKDWEIDNQARKFGEGLTPGDTYKLAFLYPNAQYDISGEGKDYASFNFIDRQDMPSVLEIKANAAPPNGQAEIDIVITYEKEGREYLKFVVLDPNIVKKQQENQTVAMYPRSYNPASNIADRKTAEESEKLRIQQDWGPWQVYWAGSDEDQRRYYQFSYRGCQVGCGPVAWAMLLGWVDHQASMINPTWTGYWGLYRQGGACNDPDADAPQDMDAGVEQMIGQIRDCVGTFCAQINNNGATWPYDMEGIRNYISCRSNIGVDIYVSVPPGFVTDNSRDRAINAIQYQRVPVILGVGFLAHYPLGYGYRVRTRIVQHDILGVPAWTDNETDRQFYINNGHGGGDNGWIPGETWFAGRVLPPQVAPTQPPAPTQIPLGPIVGQVAPTQPPAPTLTPLIPVGQIQIMENNTDRPGSDYRDFDLATPDPNLCFLACNSESQCKAFTYVRPGYQGSNAHCWLKNNIPNPVAADCCISGVKELTRDTNATPSVDYIGGGMTGPTNLTGVWNCDDGGIYYIRQLGNKIWWYGETDPNTPEWSNVMYGTVNDRTINGNWADVPKGTVFQNGEITVNIESNNRLSVIQKTGGFEGSVWSRRSTSI